MWTNHFVNCFCLQFYILPRTRSQCNSFHRTFSKGMWILQKLWHCPLHSHAIILDNSRNSFLLFNLNEIFVSDITNLSTGRPLLLYLCCPTSTYVAIWSTAARGYATVPPRVFLHILIAISIHVSFHTLQVRETFAVSSMYIYF